MKEIIAVLLFISQFGYIYCDILEDFKTAIDGCCKDTYKDDEANLKKCVESIQQGLKGGPVEENFDKMAKDMETGVKMGWVTFLSQHFLSMCKVEADIATLNPGVITAEVFGFVMSSGFNSLDGKGYKGFSEYITAQAKKGQDKVTEITGHKVSFYQYLFGCSSDAFDTFNLFGPDVFSDGFKAFIKTYYDCFFDEKEKQHNLQQCTTNQIVDTFKTIALSSPNSAELIKAEIRKCQKTNATAKDEDYVWQT